MRSKAKDSPLWPKIESHLEEMQLPTELKLLMQVDPDPVLTALDIKDSLLRVCSNSQLTEHGLKVLEALSAAWPDVLVAAKQRYANRGMSVQL